jgi:hypothetical protein
MINSWVCVDCGARQAAEGSCAACGNDPTLDMTQLRTREFMHDVELRAQLRREGRIRILGVGLGMLIVFGAWMVVPGYWNIRGRVYPGLPMFFDQWIFMALIGYGATKLLERMFAKKRFPYLRDDLTLDDEERPPVMKFR